MNHLAVLGRTQLLFESDVKRLEMDMQQMVSSSRFLVLGAAGTIGRAVSKAIFERNPKKLHVVDISENNLAELVRDVRSSIGYIDGEFKSYAIDIGSKEYDAFWNSDGEYDYVLNLSALKHVRSEKDPFTLMRMVQVNVLNTLKTAHQAGQKGAKKYFCVSTDKASDPVNLMGASKRVMEMFLFSGIFSQHLPVSMARFANVAFSDGSLLHSFTQRLQKKQPIVAPNDVQRYFITAEEAGNLCLTSCLYGENRDVFFPKTDKKLSVDTFPKLAQRFLAQHQLDVLECASEELARRAFENEKPITAWPCYFAPSDTTGEKTVESFYTHQEKLNLNRFTEIGIIENEQIQETEAFVQFLATIEQLYKGGKWDKNAIVKAFEGLLPNFKHEELHKSLDDKM